eukprot:14105602-Alexandrium_andersonii.AAC.1
MLRASSAMRADIRPSSASSIGSSYAAAVPIASLISPVSSRICTCDSLTKASPESPVGGPSTGPEAP